MCQGELLDEFMKIEFLPYSLKSDSERTLVMMNAGINGIAAVRVFENIQT